MAAHLFSRGWLGTALATALLLATTQPANAQAPADPWGAARERVEPGEAVIFEAAGVPRQTGLLQRLSPEGLTVMVAGETRHIRREDVQKLWKRGDSKLNGFLIGAGVTAVAMGALLAGLCSHDCDNRSVAVATVVYSGLGGLIGVGVDSLIVGKTLVYRRPANLAVAPIVGAHRAGVQAGFAW
jgi:hypothetical protein